MGAKSILDAVKEKYAVAAKQVAGGKPRVAGRRGVAWLRPE